MILFNRYEYNPQADLIGKGGFARVYKAFDKKLNRKVALKIYKPSELSGKYSPIAEIQRVIDLDHPNITRYIDIEELEKEDSFGDKEKIQVCVMELLEGGNLSQYYQSSNDLVVFKKLLVDVLNGLSYLHRNGITHRDIKPSNILIKLTLDGPIAKITDFGISKKADTANSNTASALIVSIPYMAPEQLNVQKYGISGKVSYNIDFWSLGVAVFEVITGKVLFRNHEEDSSEQIMSNILSSRLPKKLNTLPEPYKSFVSQCIVKDAKVRVRSAEDLVSVLMTTPNTVVSVPPVAITTKEVELKQAEISVIDLEENADQTQVLNDVPSLPRIIDVASEEEELPDGDETTIISELLVATEKPNDITSLKNEQPVLDETVLISPPEEKNIIETEDGEATGDEETTLIRNLPEEREVYEENAASTEVSENADETRVIVQEQLGKVLGTILSHKDEPVKLFNRYEYTPQHDLIGKGGFSRVYKAFDHKLGRWVALKIYKTSDYSDKYSPIAEIRRVVNLDHPNICRYLDIEEIEKKNPFGENEKMQVCVMELLDGGHIGEYFKLNPDYNTLKKLIRDILNGISYLHKKGIIHRDIKPANILIKENVEGPVAKITDFGISKGTDSANTNSSSALIVSIPFMAPEQLNPRKYGINEGISSNLDLWSLGVTLYEVITGKVLFKNSEHDTSEQIMTNIMAPEVPDKLNELPPPFRIMVAHCLVKDARSRAQKAEELMMLLNASEEKASATSVFFPPPKEQIQPEENLIPQNETKTIDDKPKEKKSAIDKPVTVAKKQKFVIEDDEGRKERKPKLNFRFSLHYNNKTLVVIGLALTLIIIFFLLRSAVSGRTALSPTKPSSKVEAVSDSSDVDSSQVKINSDEPKKNGDTSKAVSIQDRAIPGGTEESNNQNRSTVNVERNDQRNLNEPSTNPKTYLLEILSTRDCIIRVNSEEKGHLSNGNKLRIWLPQGNHVIEALGTEDSTVFYKDHFKLPNNSQGVPRLIINR